MYTSDPISAKIRDRFRDKGEPVIEILLKTVLIKWTGAMYSHLTKTANYPIVELLIRWWM
jgi:hypothetical protein